MIGNRYGKLEVKEQRPSTKHGRMWLCECECGNKIILPTKQLKLRTSCGKCRRFKSSENIDKLHKAMEESRVDGILMSKYNQKIQKNNKTGYTGVSEYHLKSGEVRYEAKLQVKGQVIKKRGFETLKEARDYRCALEKEYLPK